MACKNRLEYRKNAELYRRNFRNLHRCERCRYFTRSIFYIENHRRKHKSEVKKFDCRDSTPEEYFCIECSFSTHLKTYFKLHIREYHCLKKDNETKLDLKIRKCQCSFWTYSSLVLWEHQMKNNCTYRQSTAKSILEDDVKWYICHHCTYRTKYMTTLKRHVLDKHTPCDQIQWFRCDQCDYKTKRKSNLKLHQTQQHQTSTTHVQWFNCSQCDYKSKKASLLKCHIYNKHTNIEAKLHYSSNLKHLYNTCDLNFTIHKCDQCDYTTPTSVQLKQHKITKHKANIDCHRCHFCNYKTVYLPNLTLHIQRKHSNFDDKQWLECDQCEYRSKVSLNLTKHKRNKHSLKKKRFECDNCEYVTAKKSDLERHILRKHTADEDISWFRCDQCEAKFKIKSGLVHHQGCHSSVRKFQCAHCDYKADWKSELTKHLFRKHGILEASQIDDL